MFVLLKALIGQTHATESCADMKRAGDETPKVLNDSPALYS